MKVVQVWGLRKGPTGDLSTCGWNLKPCFWTRPPGAREGRDSGPELDLEDSQYLQVIHRGRGSQRNGVRVAREGGGKSTGAADTTEKGVSRRHGGLC